MQANTGWVHTAVWLRLEVLPLWNIVTLCWFKNEGMPVREILLRNGFEARTWSHPLDSPVFDSLGGGTVSSILRFCPGVLHSFWAILDWRQLFMSIMNVYSSQIALNKSNTAGFHTTLFCDGFTNMSCWWNWCFKLLTLDNTHSSSSPCRHLYTSNAMNQRRPFNFSKNKTCWWVCLHKAENLHLYSSSGVPSSEELSFRIGHCAKPREYSLCQI